MTVIGSSLAPLKSLFMPFTDSIDLVVHFEGLKGLEKPSVKADLAIYSHVFGVLGSASV